MISRLAKFFCVSVPELIRQFVLPLEGFGASYMVVGSVAAMAYGEPRLTTDVDIVIWLLPKDAPRFHALYDQPDKYVPPVSAIAAAAGHVQGERQLNVILPGMALKADFYVAGGELDEWGLERRRREPIGSAAIWVAPAEYVVVRKLEFYRDGGSSKHLEDIRSILRMSGENLDRAAVERFVESLGLAAEWAKAVHR